MRPDLHIAPDKGALELNRLAEPEGERLRKSLTRWLKRNKIVSILMDTPEHCVCVDMAKLPPDIKPVLTSWGSIYVVDAERTERRKS